LPGLIPVTTPEPSTVAVVGELLDQLPPVGVELKVAEVPGHIAAPVIEEGNALIVTPLVARQPVLFKVYVIVAAPPPTPTNVPDTEPTDAIAGLLLVQRPAPVGEE